MEEGGTHEMGYKFLSISSQVGGSHMKAGVTFQESVQLNTVKKKKKIKRVCPWEFWPLKPPFVDLLYISY